MTKATANTPDRISVAAADVAAERGFANLTVGEVAKAAGVSSALVHYHFDTKSRLIVASANTLAARRRQVWGGALAHGEGLVALDGTWDALMSLVHAGTARAWFELALMVEREEGTKAVLDASRRDEVQLWSGRLPGLLGELGARAPDAPDEVASTIRALCDGATTALLAGDAPADVRIAWDAFWVCLLAAHPRGGRR